VQSASASKKTADLKASEGDNLKDLEKEKADLDEAKAVSKATDQEVEAAGVQASKHEEDKVKQIKARTPS